MYQETLIFKLRDNLYRSVYLVQKNAFWLINFLVENTCTNYLELYLHKTRSV